MLKPTGESPGSEEKETFLAPGTFAWTSEPTPDLLPSPVEGSSSTGLAQPGEPLEDAVTRQVPHWLSQHVIKNHDNSTLIIFCN